MSNTTESTNKKKNIKPLVLILAALGISLVGFGGIFLANQAATQNTAKFKQSVLNLARDYAAQHEYDRALDKIEELLIKLPGDTDALSLQQIIIKEKQDFEKASQTPGFDMAAYDKANKERDALLRAQAEQLARLEKERNNQNTTDKNKTNNSAADTAASLAAQKADADARAKEASAREKEAEARRKEAELEMVKYLAEQQRLAEQKKLEDEKQKQKEEEARLEKLSQAEAEKQRKINAFLDLAEKAIIRTEYVSAKANIQNARDIDENNPATLSKLAKTLVFENIKSAAVRQEAKNLAEEANKAAPDLWEPYLVLGLIAREEKQLDKSIKDLGKATTLNPSSQDSWWSLGNAQFDAGQFQAAKQSFEKVIELDPSSTKALFNLGLTHERLNENEKAISAYQKAIAVKNDYAAAYNRIGELERTMGNIDKASTNLRMAVTLEPTNDRNHRSLGRVLLDQSRLDEAMQSFANAVRIDPKNAQNQYNMAVTLFALGRVDDAATYAGEAIKLDNKTAEHHYMFALCADYLGIPDQAKIFYANAIKLNPSYVKARIGLSALQISEGQIDEALTNLQAALKTDLQSPEVHNNLSTVYRLKKQFNLAIDHALKASQKAPQNADIAFNTANAYIGAEKWQEAEQQLKRTISIDINFGEAYARLAELYVSQNKKDDANKTITSLLKQIPNYRDKARMLEIQASL